MTPAEVFAAAIVALRNPCGPFPGTADALEAAAMEALVEIDATRQVLREFRADASASNVYAPQTAREISERIEAYKAAGIAHAKAKGVKR